MKSMSSQASPISGWRLGEMESTSIRRRPCCRPRGRAIDPFALGAIEWQLLPIQREKVLPEELALLSEEIAETADDGVITPNSMPCLGDIGNEHDDTQKSRNANRMDEQRRDETEAVQDEAGEQAVARDIIPAL
jgi:hypothetical protein